MTSETVTRPIGWHRVLPIFSVAFTAVYFICVGVDIALFAYYPLVMEIHWGIQPEASGPAMMWYGWIANSFIGGVVVAGSCLLASESWLRRLWSLTPSILIVAILMTALIARRYLL